MAHRGTTETREVHLSAGMLTELGVEVDAAIDDIAPPWRFVGVDVSHEIHTHQDYAGRIVRAEIAWAATVATERQI